MSSGDKLRLGVLGSGGGSVLDAIFRAIHERRLPVEVKAVVSDVRNAGILDVGRSHQVHTKYVYPGEIDARLAPESEHNIINVLQHERVELVVLTDFMRIIGPEMLAAFPRRIINIHPSLLPRHRGPRAWEQALAAGDTVAGCTVHYVDDNVDGGEIIAQAEVDILPGDTPDALRARIRKAEDVLYPEVVAFFAGERPFAG